MTEFLLHVRQCSVCRRWPREPCALGVALFDLGADALRRRIDPRRAKA